MPAEIYIKKHRRKKPSSGYSGKDHEPSSKEQGSSRKNQDDSSSQLSLQEDARIQIDIHTHTDPSPYTSQYSDRYGTSANTIRTQALSSAEQQHNVAATQDAYYQRLSDYPRNITTPYGTYGHSTRTQSTWTQEANYAGYSNYGAYNSTTETQDTSNQYQQSRHSKKPTINYKHLLRDISNLMSLTDDKDKELNERAVLKAKYDIDDYHIDQSIDYILNPDSD